MKSNLNITCMYTKAPPIYFFIMLKQSNDKILDHKVTYGFMHTVSQENKGGKNEETKAYMAKQQTPVEF